MRAWRACLSALAMGQPSAFAGDGGVAEVNAGMNATSMDGDII
jgi:hypothetical protein